MEPCHPADRYPSLPPADKIAVITFLCDLAIMCRPIRVALEASETELTELRKEKIEVNRERKRLYAITPYFSSYLDTEFLFPGTKSLITKMLKLVPTFQWTSV